METLLNKLTQQAMNYAIRSGVTITTSYAISQCSRLLKETKDNPNKDELARLQRRLESKIRIISPAIDMIELIAARGHTTLQSAVSLTKSIRFDIQSLGGRLASAAAEESMYRKRKMRAVTDAALDAEILSIISDMKGLIDRIEDAVPLINLAITTSGVSLSGSLPHSVSPSRLLQASTFLTAGDAQYAVNSADAVPVGPAFTLSLYMLFLGHSAPQQEDQLRNTVWQEVVHKARVKLLRVPLRRVYDFPSFSGGKQEDKHPIGNMIPAASRMDEFAYQLCFIEDLNDQRVHTFDEDEQSENGPKSIDDVSVAGIHEVIPIHQISKIFYADTGKILNINSDSESNNPVLLLKRDMNVQPPRRMMQDEDDLSQPDTSLDKSYTDTETPQSTADHGFPASLDPEWIALEVYSDTASDDEPDEPIPASSSPASLSAALSNLHLHSSPVDQAPPASAEPTITTSLSLLEMLIRLCSLQQFQQASHLTISDELLNFFLQESSTTGAAAPDAEGRKRVRMHARARVGFDPYDESPVKRRGEAYLMQRQGDATRERQASKLHDALAMSTPPSSGPLNAARRARDPETPPLPDDAGSAGKVSSARKEREMCRLAESGSRAQFLVDEQRGFHSSPLAARGQDRSCSPGALSD